MPDEIAIFGFGSLLDVVDVLEQDNEQGVTDIDTHPGYLEVPHYSQKVEG